MVGTAGVRGRITGDSWGHTTGVSSGTTGHTIGALGGTTGAWGRTTGASGSTTDAWGRTTGAWGRTTGASGSTTDAWGRPTGAWGRTTGASGSTTCASSRTTGVLSADEMIPEHEDWTELGSEDEASNPDSNPDEALESEQNTHVEGETNTHKADMSGDRPEANKESTSKEEQTGTDGGFVRRTISTIGAAVGSKLKSAADTVGSTFRTAADTAGSTLKAAADTAGSTLKTAVGYTQRKVVYNKKISINLPHGKGPKRYCRLITYRPPDCRHSPKPVITVTIKPSSDTCYYEDTHLFVRFSDFYSVKFGP